MVSRPTSGEAPFGGGAGAGHVDGLVSHVLSNAGVQGVEHEGGDDHPVGREHLAQLGSGFHNGITSMGNLIYIDSQDG